ncbi:MAG: DUF2079 domain-containing protein, partial [Gaiellaceae bacterium]
MIRPRILLVAAAISFSAGFAALAEIRHLAFWSGRFDLGNLTQAVWSTSHGRFLEITDLQGRQISRLGAHFDPLVAAFAPLWRIWPDPALLLTIQAIAVAAGAVPVFLLAKKHLASEWMGLAFGVGYLLYPATQWLVVDDFHPVALATPLLLGAFWYLDEDRVVPFAALALAACLTKEQVGFTVAAMGAWYALVKGRRLVGGAIAASGAVISYVAVAVIVPHFAPGTGSPFEGRYAAVGGSFGGMAHTALTDPARIVTAATEARDFRYLLQLLIPLALLPLFGLGASLIALPEIALNVLSDTATQTSINFHYTAVAIPGVVIGAVFGAARLIGLRPEVAPVVVRGLVGIGVVTAVALGPIPLWHHLPFGQDQTAYQYRITGRDHTAEHAITLLPRAATVSTSNTIGAHLSDRRRVLSFPLLREARWIVVDTLRMSYGDDNLAHRRGLQALRGIRQDPRWHVAFAHKG